MLHRAPSLGVRFGTLPCELDPDVIDTPLRETVTDINTSGWLWTTMCCDGDHNDGRPYIGLACDAANVGRLFTLLLNVLRFSCPDGGCANCCQCGTHCIRFQTWANPWVSSSWTDVFIESTQEEERDAMIDGLRRLSQLAKL